jgi:hypothetical protein
MSARCLLRRKHTERVVCHLGIPATGESIKNLRIAVQSDLGENQDPTSKITRAERAQGTAETEKYLSSKHKASSSTLVLPINN